MLEAALLTCPNRVYSWSVASLTFPVHLSVLFLCLSLRILLNLPSFVFPFSFSSHLGLFLRALLCGVSSLCASCSSFSFLFLTFPPLPALHSPIPLPCFHNVFAPAGIRQLLEANGVQQRARSCCLACWRAANHFCAWSAIKLGEG